MAGWSLSNRQRLVDAADSELVGRISKGAAMGGAVTYLKALLKPPTMSESALSHMRGLVEADGSAFFESLASNDLPLPSLVEVIASTMDLGSTPRLSLVASDFYLSLLLSPNAPLQTLFAPMAFASLLRSVQNSVGSLYHFGDVDVQRLFFAVLEKLVSVMGLIHLDRFPDSLKSFVQTAAELPTVVLDAFCDSIVYRKLTHLCSQLLRAALRPEHGDRANTAAEVLKSLSPLIMSDAAEVRTFALSFVKNCMVDAAKECEGVKEAVVSLLTHLVKKALEKSELSALAEESIMEIFTALKYND